jgi:hypothetical protein
MTETLQPYCCTFRNNLEEREAIVGPEVLLCSCHGGNCQSYNDPKVLGEGGATPASPSPPPSHQPQYAVSNLKGENRCRVG